MAHIKAEKVVLLNNYPVSEHSCPVSGVKYLGECPNLSCPANISQYQDNRGGCFLQAGQPTEVDVGRYLRLTTKEVRKKYSKGIKHTSKFIEFYMWLQNHRETAPKQFTCSKCGIMATNNADCFNLARCQRRQQIIKRANRRYPLNLSPLTISPQEFWPMVMAQEKDLIHILPRRSMERATKAMARITNSRTQQTNAYPRSSQARPSGRNS